MQLGQERLVAPKGGLSATELGWLEVLSAASGSMGLPRTFEVHEGEDGTPWVAILGPNGDCEGLIGQASGQWAAMDPVGTVLTKGGFARCVARLTMGGIDGALQAGR